MIPAVISLQFHFARKKNGFISQYQTTQPDTAEEIPFFLMCAECDAWLQLIGNVAFLLHMCYEGNTVALNTLLIHRYTWEQLRTGPDGGPSNLKYKGIIKMKKKLKRKARAFAFPTWNAAQTTASGRLVCVVIIKYSHFIQIIRPKKSRVWIETRLELWNSAD